MDSIINTINQQPLQIKSITQKIEESDLHCFKYKSEWKIMKQPDKSLTTEQLDEEGGYSQEKHGSKESEMNL